MPDSIPVNIVLKDKNLVHFLQDDISMFTMPDEPQGGGAWIRLCVWRNVTGDNGNILIPSNQLDRSLFLFFFHLPYLLKSKPFFSLSASYFPKQRGCIMNISIIDNRTIP